MGMLIGLHHAQITIPKGAEAQARAFYCGLLGLHEIALNSAIRSAIG